MLPHASNAHLASISQKQRWCKVPRNQILLGILKEAPSKVSLRFESKKTKTQVFSFHTEKKKKKMSGMESQQRQEEDKKPSKKSDQINLKLKGQDGIEVLMRIKRSPQLKKLMDAYCERKSVEFNSIRFLYDGRRLREHNTPEQLEMEDGDEIFAAMHQSGGTSSCTEI